MATSFIKYERFETTVPKAKELRPVVERLIFALVFVLVTPLRWR